MSIWNDCKVWKQGFYFYFLHLCRFTSIGLDMLELSVLCDSRPQCFSKEFLVSLAILTELYKTYSTVPVLRHPTMYSWVKVYRMGLLRLTRVLQLVVGFYEIMRVISLVEKLHVVFCCGVSFMLSFVTSSSVISCFLSNSFFSLATLKSLEKFSFPVAAHCFLVWHGGGRQQVNQFRIVFVLIWLAWSSTLRRRFILCVQIPPSSFPLNYEE